MSGSNDTNASGATPPHLPEDTQGTASILSDNSQTPWLVKSGDRILGPYSTDNLSQLIRDKEVVVIDEVMAPQSRWTYVRDVPAFQPVVEEIRRGLMHSREDTEVQGYTSASRVDSLAKTATAVSPLTATATGTGAATSTDAKSLIPDSDADPTVVTSATNTSTLTKTVTEAVNLGSVTSIKSPTKSAAKSGAKSAAKSPAKPGPPKPVAPTKLAMEPLPHHTKEASKEAATPTVNKNYVRPKMGGSQSSVIIGSLVLVIAAVYIIYTVLKSPQMGHTAANSDNLQTQASVAWKRGEFERALELYRALNHSQPKQPIIAARLATLMMKIEGQTVEAKRVIESAQDGAKDDDEKAALAIAAGLAALQNDDPKQAAASFAQAKATNSPATWIASYDEGIAFTLMKNWTEAAKSFQAAGENAVALLMLARTHLSEGDAGVSKVAARREADDAIRKALVQAPDYQQESLLVAAYIDALSGNAKRASKEALEAVETDPNQTADHFHDPGLSLDQVSWSKLLPYCQGLHQELNSRVSGALLGICLAKANQLEQANKVIEGELAREGGNTYLHAVAAYLHTLSDRDDAARASLTLSTKNGNSRLAQILNARLCMREKQDACAEDGWSKLASEGNPPIAAMTGLAQLREQRGDTAAANALLVKAESMSPKYLPLLRLREDVSR